MAKDIKIKLRIDDKGAVSVLDKIDKEVINLGKSVNKVSKGLSFKSIFSQLTSLSFSISNIASAFNTVTGIFKNTVGQWIELANIQEAAVTKVEQAITSTGKAAGFTGSELEKIAQGLQEITTFGDEQILNEVTAQLLTFTNVAGEQFKRTQKAALDVATVLGGDLQSVTIQLGKALNDPVANLGALSRSGIQFSKDQKTLIKSLTETNQLAEAQNIILKELEKQYGGQAEALAQTSGGALKQFQNVFGDLKEELGATFLPLLVDIVEKLKGFVIDIRDFMEDNKKEISDFVQIVLDVFTIAIEVIGNAVGIIIDFGKTVTDVVDFIVEGYNELIGSQSAEIRKQREANQTAREAVEELRKLKQNIINLTNEYINLAEETENTEENTKRLNQIYNTLKAQYPGIISGSESFGEALDKVKKVSAQAGTEIESLNEKQLKLKKLEFEIDIKEAQENIKDILDDTDKLKNELFKELSNREIRLGQTNEAENNIIKLTNKWKTAFREVVKDSESSSDDIKNIQKDLQNELINLRIEILEGEKEGENVQNLKNQYEELNNVLETSKELLDFKVEIETSINDIENLKNATDIGTIKPEIDIDSIKEGNKELTAEEQNRLKAKEKLEEQYRIEAIQNDLEKDLEKLNKEYEQEIQAAEALGADKENIDIVFQNKRLELLSGFYKKEITEFNKSLIDKEFEYENYINKINELQEQIKIKGLGVDSEEFKQLEQLKEEALRISLEKQLKLEKDYFEAVKFEDIEYYNFKLEQDQKALELEKESNEKSLRLQLEKGLIDQGIYEERMKVLKSFYNEANLLTEQQLAKDFIQTVKLEFEQTGQDNEKFQVYLEEQINLLNLTEEQKAEILKQSKQEQENIIEETGTGLAGILDRTFGKGTTKILSDIFGQATGLLSGVFDLQLSKTRDHYNKLLQTTADYYNNEIGIVDEFLSNLREQYDTQEEIETEKFELNLETLNERMEQELAVFGLTEQQKLDIENKYRKLKEAEEVKNQKAKEKRDKERDKKEAKALKDKQLLEKKAADEKIRIQKEAEKKELEIKRNQQKVRIAEALQNTYSAAIKAFESVGNPVLGAILAAIATAFGLGQVALIRAQGFATGGYTGNKGVSQVAGVVHGGEVVFEKSIVDKNLDSLMGLRAILQKGERLDNILKTPKVNTIPRYSLQSGGLAASPEQASVVVSTSSAGIEALLVQTNERLNKIESALSAETLIELDRADIDDEIAYLYDRLLTEKNARLIRKLG